MEAVLSRQRIVVAIATSAAGFAVFWLTKSPFGLLAPTAALFLFARRRTAMLLHAVSTAGLVVSLFVAALYTGAMHDAAISWGTFFAMALCVGATVATSASASLSAEAIQAMRIIESMPAHTWSASADGRHTYVSASTLSYIGQPVEHPGLFHDLDNAGWRRAVHPDDYAGVLERRRHCLETGAPYDTEYRIRRRDGVYRWFRSFGSASRDDHGRILGWHGTMIDIEEQKQAEAALRERERELSQLVDMVPSHLWRLTPDGEPIFFNKRMVDFLGLDVADTDKPGMSRLEAVIETVHPDDAENFRNAITRSVATGASFYLRYRLRRVDGVYRWMSSRAEPLRDQSGRIVQWYGLCHDIDDEVRTQEALRERERELSLLVAMVPSLLWRLAPNGEPVFFSKRMIDFFGLDAADVGKPDSQRLAAVIETVVHPDDAAGVREALDRSFATGERFSMTYRLRRADGMYRWMSGRAEPMRDEDGRIVQWYGLAHDIDDQIHAEDVLRLSERSLRQLVETLPAMIYCAAPDGEPIYRSQKLRDFLGFDLEDKDEAGRSRLLGTLDSVIHPDDLPTVKQKYGRSLATGEPYAHAHRLRRFDDEYRWVETRAAPMRNADGEIVQWNGVCLEIEDQVRAQDDLRLAQERLARASQAASLAELSASIAHEVNQPLAAIVANSHACQRWLKSDPPNLDRAQITVERVIRDANSAADVVSRIRSLFKQSVEPRSSTPLPGVITEARDLMSEDAARRRVRIDVDIESDLPLVAFDRVQLQQVLINLIRNGMDAMESTVDEKIIGICVRRTADAVRIAISDRGRGVAFPEKVFEPFFTTKGHGMGMGLAICRSIVESHGGRLWAEKNEPHGATFIFTLPVEATP